MDRDVAINFMARTGGLRQGAGEVLSILHPIQSAIKEIAKVSLTLGVTTTTAWGFAVKAASGFEEQMHNVNSVIGASSIGFNRLSQDILDLATKVPKSATELARGAYAIASAGFTSASQTQMVLEASARAATAGLADTTIAANAMVTVLNAYNMSASDAAHVSDVLFQTVQVGQTDFTQLATQLGDFVGLGHAVGASFEETAATFALLTVSTGQQAQSATALQGLFRALINPSQELTLQLAKMGFESGQAAVQALGFTGAINAIIEAAHGSPQVLQSFFQDTEALRGALVLQGKGQAAVAENLSKFTDKAKVAGATNRAMAEQAKSLNYQIQQLKTTLGAVAIEFGQGLTPAVMGITKVLTFLARLLHEVPDEAKHLFAILSALAGIVVTAASAFYLLKLQLAVLSFAMKAIGATGMINWIRALVERIPVAKAAVDGMTMSVAKLQAVATGLGIAFVAWQILKGPIETLVNGKHNVEAFTKALVELQDTGNSQKLSSTFGNDFDKLAGKINNFADKGLWDKVWDTARGKRDVIPLWQSKTVKDVDDLDKALSKLVQSGNIEDAKKQFADIQDKLLLRGVSQGKIDQAFNDYLSSIDSVNLGNRATGKSADDLANSLGGEASALDAAGRAAQSLAVISKDLSISQHVIADSFSAGFESTSGILDRIISDQSNAYSEAHKSGTKNVKTALDIESSQLGIERAVKRRGQAEKDLQRAQQQNPAELVAKAERDVQAAYDGQVRATYRLQDALDVLNKLRNPDDYARTVTEAEIAVGRATDAEAQTIMDLKVATDKLNYAREVGIPDEVAASQREYNEAQRAAIEASFRLKDATKQLADVQQGSDVYARKVSEAQLDVNDSLRSQADASDGAKTATQALADVRANDGTEAIAEAQFALREAILGVKQAQEALAQTQDGTAGAAADKFNEKMALMTLSLKEFDRYLQEQITAQENWGKNLEWVAQHYGERTAAQFAAMGIKSSGLIDKMRQDGGASAQALAEDLDHYSLIGSKAFAANLAANINKGDDVKVWTANMVKALADELGIGIPQAIAMLEKYGQKLDETANKTFKLTPQEIKNINDVGALVGMPGLGDVFQQAKGGVQGAVVKRPTILFGERETGQELFLPQKGISHERATGLLGQGAAWYGYSLTPMAKGGVSVPLPPSFQDFAKMMHVKKEAIPARGAAEHLYKLGLVGIAALSKAATKVQEVSQQATLKQQQVVPSDIASWFDSAVQLAKVGADWIPGLTKLAKAESGFNIMAVNPQAVGGEHATGVMQMLPSTFRAHMMKGHEDIYNPIDNIVSAIDYIHDRYGHVNQTPLFTKGGKYVGYRRGGIMKPFVADTGGTMMPFSTALIQNSTPYKEPIGPPSRGFGGGLSGPLAVVHVYTSVEADRVAIGKAVESAITPKLQKFADKLTDQVGAR